ncbi:hypothetical protein [Herbiconiux ginsengi]|uniref:Uncharacterized protein n=1 Tax=Herbiconiux ginsengi TaxID=381665 RepID=A0A1H3TFS3_9MICO|nr:hypothetical protein [Herbiconiux ginsengi]SDZ48691.1 hypothetical protein SAMN05216554_4150 [Herbiconiux ginsengi]
MPRVADPIDFELILTPNPEAPEGLRVVAEQYWEFEGIDPDTDEIWWTRKTSVIDYKPWSGTAYYAAAAGVQALSPTFACSNCEKPLTLSSRQTLADARRGSSVQCRNCNGTVNDRSAAILNPNALAKRARRLEDERVSRDAYEAKIAERQQAREQEQRLVEARRNVVEAEYPAELDDGGNALANATLRAKVGALAAIHAFETPSGLVYPVKYDATLAPSFETSRELFVAAFRAKLFLIHPTSAPSAFVWDDEDPLAMTGSFYPEQARFVAPGEGLLTRRLEDHSSGLRSALDVESLWSTDRRDLIALSVELVADEAIRYFSYFMMSLNLPDPAVAHLETLRSHTAKAATKFPLGQIYRMAWSSSRDALAAHERNRGMSKDNAATHAVNRFGQWVQRALDNPDSLGEPFNEDTLNLPLSAATDIVFRVVLGMQPMRATPSEVIDALGGSPDQQLRRECDWRIPERTGLIEWLRTDQSWTGQAFREALERVADEQPSLCAPGCAHERASTVAYQCGQAYDRMVSRLGEQDSTLAVAESTLIGNKSPYDGLTGNLVLAKVLVELGWVAVDEAGEE